MVSTNLLLTKRAVLLTQQQPKQQIPGIFSMSSVQLEWKPNAPNSSQEVTAEVATISGQQFELKHALQYVHLCKIWGHVQVSCSVPRASQCLGFPCEAPSSPYSLTI